MLKRCVFLALLLMSLVCHGEELLMANIKSDVDEYTYQFYVETAIDQTVEAVRVVWYDGKGRKFRDDTHLAQRVIDEGVVLIEQKGREAVRLEVENFSVKTGGAVVMNYLYNGVTGSRKNYRLSLKKMGSKFTLIEENSQKEVNDFFVFGNKVPVFGLVGIRDIQGKFRPKSFFKFQLSRD